MSGDAGSGGDVVGEDSTGEDDDSTCCDAGRGLHSCLSQLHLSRF